jgi:DNA-binding CsgD family transcriptional regulator
MEFTDAALHLQKALDLARACEVPYERALTILALADLRVATGARDAALSLLEKARTILVLLGATPAVARVDDLLARISPPATVTTLPAGLTRREVEVLRLLVAHRTDKEIAEALFISPHTASTHVKHLLNKLGVANRRDAALYAVDHDLA